MKAGKSFPSPFAHLHGNLLQCCDVLFSFIRVVSQVCQGYGVIGRGCGSEKKIDETAARATPFKEVGYFPMPT